MDGDPFDLVDFSWVGGDVLGKFVAVGDIYGVDRYAIIVSGFKHPRRWWGLTFSQFDGVAGFFVGFSGGSVKQRFP